MNILARIATPDGRRALVERFHGLHTETEAALEPWLAELPGLDFEARRRAPRLARDLQVLGGQAPAAPADPIVVGGVGEALGRMYVLEGSTLGGRVIRRSLEAQGDGMAGLGFLDPYGDQVGERWRSFLAVIDGQACSAADTEAMVAGALAGFRHAELWLCEDPAHV